ncbi:MAG: RHS repeat-associated core domain-containing protein [Pseudomonadota bacterium]
MENIEQPLKVVHFDDTATSSTLLPRPRNTAKFDISATVIADGPPIDLPAPEMRFPGQLFQMETGLRQNRRRNNDPTTGRYIQPDPLGLIDGPSIYGYASQSPLTYIDPRGEAGVNNFTSQIIALIDAQTNAVTTLGLGEGTYFNLIPEVFDQMELHSKY